MKVQREQIGPQSTRLHLVADQGPLSWRQVAQGLQTDSSLKNALVRSLLDAPEAIYWEARPVHPDDQDQPFACMVLDAPALSRIRADGSPFREPLAGARAPEVRRFPNLGGDAELVVPAPGEADYPHLGAFLRRAPGAQIDALWSAVGQGVQHWLRSGRGRLWVSTAGLGVHWLHIRLDSRPKYVKWGPYRDLR